PLPALRIGSGSVARRGRLARDADADSRSVFRGVLFRRLPEYTLGRGRRLRRLDARLLRRRTCGGAGPPARTMTRAARTRPRLLAAAQRPPRPRQRRSLEKRARLEEAAIRLFGERGYEKTSVEEIARRAHLAVGGFYQHFKSKRQLLVALMDELVDHLSRLELRPAAAGDPRAVIHMLISTAFDRDLAYLGA